MPKNDPQPNDIYVAKLSVFGVIDHHVGGPPRPLGVVDRYETHAVVIGRTTKRPKNASNTLFSPIDVTKGLNKVGYWDARFAHPISLWPFGTNGCKHKGTLVHPESTDLENYWLLYGVATSAPPSIPLVTTPSLNGNP